MRSNRSNIYIICLFGLYLAACNTEPKQSITEEKNDVVEYASNEYLIEVEELAEEMKDNPDLVIIDVRKPESYFEQGHISGAKNLWRSDIESEEYEYRGMMASRDQVESLMGRLGCSNNSKIVLYDGQCNVDASRFWWILMYYGHEKMALLNGGLTAWKMEGHKLKKDTVYSEKVAYSFKQDNNDDWLADIKEVEAALNNPGSILVDTRTIEEYSGKRQKKNSFAGGRIPGSIWIDWANAVNFNDDHRFKSYTELMEIYAGAGLWKEQKVITYCHSGVRSAHTAFVLTQLLGFEQVKNYDGSWTEWSYHKELPIEIDSITTILM